MSHDSSLGLDLISTDVLNKENSSRYWVHEAEIIV